MGEKTVPELARDTLKQLVIRKLAPTPANYQAIFNEIGGFKTDAPFPAEQLRKIAQELPAKTPGQQKQRSLMEYAISQLSWEGVHHALVAYGSYVPKTESSGFGALSTSEVAPLAHVPPSSSVAPALTTDFLEQIARLIEFVRPALGTDDARFSEQTDDMLKVMRKPGVDVMLLKQMLGSFGHRVSFATEEQVEIKRILLLLVQLIFENIGKLSQDDHWLMGQIDALKLAATPPITLRRLDEVERKLREVIVKQSDAKGLAQEAQEEMRQMLRVFVERLSDMSSSTGTFGEQMEKNAMLIEQAKSLSELTPVLNQMVTATRAIAQQALDARDELKGMQEHAEVTKAEIVNLHLELDRVSAQAHHDTLTGALNRKGLEEALTRELAVVRRNQSALCVALLDIDNFKRINDERGHAVGDEALAHLAKVARNCMRPQDTLARYGGEEFVILLPDTPLDQGIEAMVRLQRDLTKKFFLDGAEKLLITFSAGVAQLSPDEDSESAIKRADNAMYAAKRAGKNRVLGA